nr:MULTISPECIES: SDR family oxidoreductase [Frankia]
MTAFFHHRSAVRLSRISRYCPAISGVSPSRESCFRADRRAGLPVTRAGHTVPSTRTPRLSWWRGQALSRFRPGGGVRAGGVRTRPLREQVVVVVGASSGIGRATALAFAQRGARVVCAARGEEALHALVGEISGEVGAGRAFAVPTDVADPAAVRELAASAERRLGRIDTWVNAAAVSVLGRVEDVTDAEFDRVLRINLLGQVHGAKAALPALRRAGGGVLIGVSSVEGIRAMPLHSAYAASKWGLRGFYDSLRVELAQEGVPIAVTTVLPPSVDTPFFAHARSRIGGRPKPPPPVYAADVVAAAIVRAAVRPSREVLVGGTAVAAAIAARVSPALVDALLSLRRAGIETLREDRPGEPGDIVDAPEAGPGRVDGDYPGRVLRHSPLTSLLGVGRRPVELLTAAVGRLHRSTPPGTAHLAARGAAGGPPPPSPSGMTMPADTPLRRWRGTGSVMRSPGRTTGVAGG